MIVSVGLHFTASDPGDVLREAVQKVWPALDRGFLDAFVAGILMAIGIGNTIDVECTDGRIHIVASPAFLAVIENARLFMHDGPVQ